MTVNELRSKYIEFFKSKGHVEISGKSLIPNNDPTVLFTTAGMQPLVPYLLGEPHPSGTRLTDYQKCVRTGDIDSVGDPAHLTFFEMLGNWSLGAYFKQESIAYSYEFLTDPKYLGIPSEKLSVTVFEGENANGTEIPRDDEAASRWEEMGIPRERIYFMPREDNWWGPAGQTGPCGPDTEIFYDTGKPKCGPDCKPGCHCGKFVEIWNNVFMQYNKDAEGHYTPLARKCVDTGMGAERTVAMLNGQATVYDTDVFVPIINKIEELSGKKYGTDEKTDRSFRVIADHVRTATFILGDPQAVTPSNVGAGYILRRIIRRAVRDGRKLGLDGTFLTAPAAVVIEEYKNAYPELEEHKDFIFKEIENEEKKFLNTLKKGEAEFEKLLPNLQKNPQKIIPGRVAFRLYDTFGFPIELTQEMAEENGMKVDVEGFKEAEKKHQELSRDTSGQQFKGGLIDHSEITTKYHTATHLLQQALVNVLGPQVAQKGSNITSERMRFDFSFERAMTKEEIKKVEDIVNEQIAKDLPVTMEVMDLEAAKKSGARALFGEKYDKQVSVYTIGDFSKEVCGGPHVQHTGLIGHFHIVKEQSSSAGVRRIRAVID
ncbi:alanine--tRNA ligase [Treponema peruense]|uniref:Alanine--tRNA ligase n=1 Tax=Treponema peruense TaxID=2787628 RepID=A0A7T3RCD0_9SPIR|nr:alanine--tRNA ligase [Treponema peruense]QQA00528.1 alanine--tRNA ligase [Treponema peruense]